MAMSVMPSPRCSFNVNGALSFEPSTWKPEGALVRGFEGADVTGRGTDTAGLGGVVAGVLGLLLAGLLDLGMVAVFGLILVAGLDLALDYDGDLRLIVPALDLVFAAALAFGTDFVFLCAPRFRSERQPAMSRQTQSPTKVDGQRELAIEIPPQPRHHTPNDSETAPASVRVVGQARPPAAQGLRTG